MANLAVNEGARFSANQIAELENEFSFNRYITRRRKIYIAHNLGSTIDAVGAWFISRRRVFKLENKIGSPNTAEEESPAESDNHTETDDNEETPVPELSANVSQGQWSSLESEFKFNRFLTRRHEAELAELLGIPQDDIKRWFHRRRFQYQVDNKLPVSQPAVFPEVPDDRNADAGLGNDVNLELSGFRCSCM